MRALMLQGLRELRRSMSRLGPTAGRLSAPGLGLVGGLLGGYAFSPAGLEGGSTAVEASPKLPARWAFGDRAYGCSPYRTGCRIHENQFRCNTQKGALSTPFSAGPVFLAAVGFVSR